MSDDERSKPAPGTGVVRDRDGLWWWVVNVRNGILGRVLLRKVAHYTTEPEAIAATWEHADAVWEAHPRTAELRDQRNRQADRANLAQEEIDALRAEVTEAKKESAAHELERLKLRKECDALRAEVEDLTNRVEFLRKRDSEHMTEKAKLRATIKRHDRAMQCEQDAAGAIIGALRDEVGRLKNDHALAWMQSRAEKNAHERELAQLRRDGCLGEARTGVPDGPCWAWVEAISCFGKVWRSSRPVEFGDPSRGQQIPQGYNITRWRPIPEPKGGE